MDLLEKFLPIFVFHPKETVYPCSVEEYLKYSSLVTINKTSCHPCNCVNTEILPNLHLGWNIENPNNVIRPQYTTHVPRGNITQLIDPINFNKPNLSLNYTGPLTTSFISKSPVYTYVHTKENITSLYYWLFYPNQTPYMISLCSKPFYLGGQHTADIETIRLDYDVNKKTIIKAYYYRHGKPISLEYNEITKLNNRPVVYISLISHASYHLNGVNIRWLGLLNDYTVPINEGTVWKPNRLNIQSLNNINETKLNNFILNYKGYMGFNGIYSFANRIIDIHQ